jgi:hypothetical protein
MQAIAACAGNRQQQMAFTAPAQFLIVQDPGTNRCSIVQQENGSGSVVERSCRHLTLPWSEPALKQPHKHNPRLKGSM